MCGVVVATHIAVCESEEMRICYITTDSLAEGVGQSQILPLIKGLNRNGNKVSIISLEKHFENQPALVSELTGINWTPLPFGPVGIIGGLKRIYAITKNIPEADIYHARSDISALSLILAKKGPFLWDVRSLWMEQKVVIGNKRLRLRLIAYFWIVIEKLIARRAKAVNTLAESLYPALEQRCGQLPYLRSVIPTCVNLREFQFREMNSKKAVLLSGSLNNFYDIERTEKLLNYLGNKGYRLLWCRPRESSTKDLKVKDLQIVEASHAQMPRYIGDCALGIAICKEDAGLSLKGVMPTKIAEFLAVGRPVIVSKGMGDLDSLLEKYRAGVIASSDMALEQVLAQVEEILKDSETSFRCRELAESHFNMGKAIEKYEKTYLEMLKN